MSDATVSRPRNAARNHRSYAAFIGHRLSGVALAVFLPVHFLALGLALEGRAALDGFLAYAENPLVKFGEWGLVILLGLHLFFGIRLLVVELLPWRGDEDDRAGMIGWGVALAVALGLVFLWGVI